MFGFGLLDTERKLVDNEYQIIPKLVIAPIGKKKN